MNLNDKRKILERPGLHTASLVTLNPRTKEKVECRVEVTGVRNDLADIRYLLTEAHCSSIELLDMPLVVHIDQLSFVD